MKISRSHRLANILSVTKGAWELINIVLLLAILLVLIANLFAINKFQFTLWEYKIESVEDLVFDQVMQRMGSEGWELASARRALAGEDSSSRGIYECIFKRPATKARIRENDKKLEAEAKESALQSVQLPAKLNVGSINRAQQAIYIETNAFASTIEELELGLKSETENYAYSLTVDSNKSLVTATAKTDD